MNIKFRVLLISLNITIHLAASAQDRNYFEIIRDDSVMLFFKSNLRFTEKTCADYIRYTRVDSLGNFNGYFKDISTDEIILGTGYYLHGIKNGYFRIYYPNGNIKCKGTYINNLPLGRWDFYYENERSERTLMLTESDTLLVQFNDKDGKALVSNGEGEFNGLVRGANNVSFTANELLIIAKGEISGGKPDGKWTSTLSNQMIYCNEVFAYGKFIKGVFPNSIPPAKKNYTTRSFLNTFFLDNYFRNLEKTNFQKCQDSTMASSLKTSTVKYSFDIDKFFSDLKPRIEQIINDDIRNGYIDKYPLGENYMIIQFSINSNGKPENYEALSSFGNQFIYSIENAIDRNVKFSPSLKTMYFHLNIHFTGNYAYRINFHFSRSPVK